MTPIHKFTHTGGKVLLLRSGKIGHKGFQWPESGKVICPKAQANRKQAKTPYCGSGGLFGWPWGIGIGDDKRPNFTENWIVFAANPKDVIRMGHQAKAIGECEVIHCGPWYECFKIVEEGKIAWLKDKNDNYTAATKKDYSIAVTNRDWSTVITSGYNSTTATNGHNSTITTSGCKSTAATSGHCSTATTSGRESTAATSGRESTAATSGINSTAAVSGYYSTAVTNGDNSIATATNSGCIIKALGKHSIAAATEASTFIKVGNGSVGIIYASEFKWETSKNSRIIQITPKKEFIFYGSHYNPATILTIKNGKIIKKVSPTK